MRGFHRGAALLALSTAPALFGQAWEVGGGAGASFYNTKTVTGRNNQSGNANPQAGFGVTGYIGHNNYHYVGGEFRYTMQFNDLQVSSGGTKATFGGRSQALHYDVLIHTASTRQKVRPFVAFGGGVKAYQGTGKETVTQPLASLAFLTKTSELKPLVSFGAGVKFKVSEKAMFRVDLRDYFGPAPNRVIAPAPGATLKGWIHNFVFLAGISYTFD
jgi:hypothetical protein